MIDLGRKNVLGVGIDAVDYEAAAARILAAARERRPFAASALAVHGVMTGVADPAHRARLNGFDLLTPDGQPVRWAMRLTGQANLPDRVYGPFLTLRVCEAAAAEGLGVFLFGATAETLARLETALGERFPGLRIVGRQPSRFRRVTEAERDADAAAIRETGAALVLVGLGCPRQEVWAWEMRDRVGVPLLAVGAAFDFLAGRQRMAPAWMQRGGLEWLFRLASEPRRLWQRYLLLNPWFCWRLFQQWTGWRRVELGDVTPPAGEERFG